MFSQSHSAFAKLLFLLMMTILKNGLFEICFASEGILSQGEYMFRASGGCSCHINNEGQTALTGGRAMKTPFGIYYSTNITPDKETGIGNWSLDKFSESMTHGIRPDGSNLFPVFPYTSFTKMKRDDIADIGRYILSRPAVKHENQAPDAPLPMQWRWTISFWKYLFLRDKSPWQTDKEHSPNWNRGAYLVTAVSHCGECHSPRNLFGAMKISAFLSGTMAGPDGDAVPNITPDKNGISDWSEDDIASYLKTGAMPDGDYAGGLMAELIDQGYKYLTDEDARAIAIYLKSVPPLAGVSKSKKKNKSDASENF